MNAHKQNYQGVNSSDNSKSSGIVVIRTGASPSIAAMPNGMSQSKKLTRNIESDKFGQQTQNELKMHHESMLQQVDMRKNMHFVQINQTDQTIPCQRNQIERSGSQPSDIKDSVRKRSGAPMASPETSGKLRRHHSQAPKSSFYIQALKNEFIQSHTRMGFEQDQEMRLVISSNDNSDSSRERSGEGVMSLGSMKEAKRESPQRSRFASSDNQMHVETSNNCRMLQNSTQENYQQSRDSSDTKSKIDLILEKILTDAPNIKQPKSFIELSQSSDSYMATNQSLEALRFTRQLRGGPKNSSRNPFEKSIEKVLSFEEIPEARAKELDRCLSEGVLKALITQATDVKQMILTMQFLVKFKGISYLHCQWMAGTTIVENFDASSIQTLLQFLEQVVLFGREKLEQKNIFPEEPDNVKISLNGTCLEPVVKSLTSTSWIEKLNSEQTFFNPQKLKVEKVLCTPTMYPLIHQSGISQVFKTWKDECLKVLDVLLHIQKDNCSFGLKFSTFDPAYSIDEVEEKRERIEKCLGSPFQIVNLTQLQNLLFNKGMTHPQHFWESLGKIFKAYMILDEDEQSPNRQFCAILRALSLYLFKLWKKECVESYQLFKQDLISNDQRIYDASAALQNKLETSKRNSERQNELQQNLSKVAFHQSISSNSKLTNFNDFISQILASADQKGQTQQVANKHNLQDLQLFQQILNQNEKILKIQSQLSLDSRENKEMQSLTLTLNLFMENQELLQKLLFNLQSVNPYINAYQKDLVAVKQKNIGQQDESLIELRNKLLTQNSYDLEQLTRRKIYGSSDSSSNDQQAANLVLNSNSDCSSLDKPPIFIFTLLNGPNGQAHVQQPKPLQISPQQAVKQDISSNEFGMQGSVATFEARGLPQQQGILVANHQSFNFTQPLPKQKLSTVKTINASPIKPNNQNYLQIKTANSMLDAECNTSIVKLHDTIKSFLSTAKGSNTQSQSQRTLSNNQNLSTPAEQQDSENQGQFGRFKILQSPLGIQQEGNQLQKPQLITQQNQKHLQLNKPSLSSANAFLHPLNQQTTQQIDKEGVEFRELNWLLNEGETVNEIQANPYLFKDDVQALLSSLFEKDQSQEGDQNNSFDILRYYLDKMYQQGHRATNSLQQKVAEFDCLSFEPLFLVKWKSTSYAQISWEPLSALKGDNLRQVKEFLTEKRYINMRARLINSKNINNHKQLLQIEHQMRQANSNCSSSEIFNSQKAHLDSYLTKMRTSHAQQKGSSQENCERGKISKETLLKSKNIKLIELQKRSLNSLDEAFMTNKNKILADQHGLGKRVTLINFMQNLKTKHNVVGQFLVIATESNLTHWKYLLDKWTDLKTLIYHDSDKECGMENLHRWALYHLDVTVKGRMTTRNQLYKFDVLLTTVEHINNDDDLFIRKVPFLQVIVDNSEIESHRLATNKIACKRIICSTSNPMPTNFSDMAGLLSCIDPQFIDALGCSKVKVFSDICSLRQIQHIQQVLNPYVVKSFQHEIENMFGQVNQIELEVKMTAAQRLFYKQIYETHAEIIINLGSIQTLSKRQMCQIELVDDLLQKSCSSIFLIDKEEKLMEKCQLSKRELKNIMKIQEFASGKMVILKQIVEDLQKNSKKMIICSHYPHMLILLKRYFKETGIACFMFQPNASIDSVFRFNLYSGQAVFLLQLGQTWTKEECSFFDLDFIQNIVIFDQKGASENDLINLFQVCSLPFSVDLNVYRLISENSYEQKMYERQKRARKIKSAVFSNRNIWNRSDDLKQSLRLEFPVRISTAEECSGCTEVHMISTSELDILLKLSAEQVVVFQNFKNDRNQKNQNQQKVAKTHDFCFTQAFQDLLNVQEDHPQLHELITKSKQKSHLRNSDRLLDLCESLKSLDQSSLEQMPNLRSANFYYKIFGLDFGTPIDKDQIKYGITKNQQCDHKMCRQFFIEKLAEDISVLPNRVSKLGQSHIELSSVGRCSHSFTRSKESKTISLVMLLQGQTLLSRQYQKNRISSTEFMKQSTQNDSAAINIHKKNDKAAQKSQTLNRNEKLQAAPLPNNLMACPAENKNFMTTINRLGKNNQDHKADLFDHQMRAESHSNISFHRKNLSEEGKQDSQQLEYQDYEEMRVMKRQKKTSEDNTLRKSFDCGEHNKQESEDRTVQMQVDESKESPDVQHSSANSIDLQTPFQHNQPDKKLSNGNVCQMCFLLLNESKVSESETSASIFVCAGACKQMFHADCAKNEGLIVPGSLESLQNSKNSKSSKKQSGKNSSQQTFMCQSCSKNEAKCYYCKRYGQISTQSMPKDRNQESSNSDNQLIKSIGCGSSDQVEKCIVGSCFKYYHFSCLQQNQNVDIYTNNKNQTRFRCPLHYCCGCSISGNSVQILQCVACPTSYHLKCFRADRGAVKLTKKFILCGQHTNLHKNIQRLKNGLQAKNSSLGYSLLQKIDQHKHHQMQQVKQRRQHCGPIHQDTAITIADNKNNQRMPFNVQNPELPSAGSKVDRQISMLKKKTFHQRWILSNGDMKRRHSVEDVSSSQSMNQVMKASSVPMFSDDDQQESGALRSRNLKATFKVDQRTTQALLHSRASPM